MDDSKAPPLEGVAHLLVRKADVLCTRCGTIEPVNPGHGTPMGTFVVALRGVLVRHPAESHEPPWRTK